MAETIDEAIGNVVAMSPINPGAFGNVPAGMQMGQMSPTDMQMMMGQAPQGSSLDPRSQESMMGYLQQKIQEIRNRMSGQETPMGALGTFMQAQQPSMPMRPPTQGMQGAMPMPTRQPQAGMQQTMPMPTRQPMQGGMNYGRSR